MITWILILFFGWLFMGWKFFLLLIISALIFYILMTLFPKWFNV